MNELGNIGFTYDIKTFTPDGEKKDDFSVHNLITDEGLRWIVAKIFVKDAPAPSFSENSLYSSINGLVMSFMTKSYTPNKKMDSFPTFIETVGEIDLTNNLAYIQKSTDYVRSKDQRVWMSVKKIDPSTNTVTFYDYNYYGDSCFKCINSPIILTGIFFLACVDDTATTRTYGSIRRNCDSILLSEAMFPEPIFLEVGGTLEVNCGCTVISA